MTASVSDTELAALIGKLPPPPPPPLDECRDCGKQYERWYLNGQTCIVCPGCSQARIAARTATVTDLPIGAAKAATRLTERIGRTVTSRDVKALAGGGLLTPVGEHKGWPIYAPADLDALDAGQITAVMTEQGRSRRNDRRNADANPSMPSPARTEIKDGSGGLDGTKWETGPPDDGDALLEQVHEWIGRYLSTPSEHYLTVLTLWAAHTHASEAFYVTPRLIIDSAEPQSGKTRVLELLNLLTRAPIFTMNTTIAALYRRLATSPRTILLDETDAIFAKGAAQNHEDLRALLNAGYKRGATVDRCVIKGQEIEVVEFPAFAPAALAGIAGNMPDTITDRAVTLSMRRRAPGEQIAEFIEEDAAVEAAPLQRDLARWMNQAAVDRLKGGRPEMPEGVRDRKAEIWRALLAVADAAGAHWPKLAREACEYFVLSIEQGGQSLNIRLLSDIYTVFESMPLADFWATNSLLTELKQIEDAPWSDFDLTARKLASRLKRFGVVPQRDKAQTARGYYKINFSDAFTRYLPTHASSHLVPSKPSDPSLISESPSQGTDGLQDATRLANRLDGGHGWWLAGDKPSHPGCDQCAARRPGPAA